jgi:hypothetical protein
MIPKKLGQQLGKTKMEKELGTGKRKNSKYLQCSTIGRMKKKEKLIW